MPSIFTRIINREIPGHIVAEDDHNIAFLDVNPLKVGHVLCVPKEEVNYIFDLDEDTYINLHAFTKKVAKAVEAAVPCKRIGVAVIGLEVPHVHIHLIPLQNISDIDFSKPKLSLSQEELTETAEKIKKQLK
ncbi:HIT family protein [uncultured Roseivirga sp.]|uniref:HIT family protein n=1 Tax=uncultured Roseivirga sp. TaxID=543088 RepID=UPI0030D77D30|tara:strand:- start:1598 stop:1993 length:396 start_codon:yes stop_codon:yes gene_type:complete